VLAWFAVIAPLDIFRKESYSTSVWIESCLDLETAKARIRMLMVSNPGEYFIFSTKTGHKQFFKPEGITDNV
jgi:hypothetical protein